MSGAKVMLLGLFRSQSRAEKGIRDEAEVRNDPELSGDITSTHRQRNYLGADANNQKSRDRKGPRVKRRSDSLRRSPTSTKHDSESTVAKIPNFKVAKWPPENLPNDGSLSQRDAEDLITAGAPIYHGSRIFIPHTSEQYFALYSTCEGSSGATDRAKFYSPAFAVMSFHIYDTGVARRPWDTLEQPSLAFCYGKIPGTITLNHWASLSSRLKPSIELRDPDVRPRDVNLAAIIDRLIDLEGGQEEDDEDLRYKTLYRKLLKDPDRLFSPRKAMEKQIADLIVVLSGPQWIDFSNPRNQVVAKFFAQVNYAAEDEYKRFFHQLLLSIELDIRIHSRHHADAPKQHLLSQLPPCIAWDLALSRRWRECMRIENVKEKDGSMRINLHLRVKKRQVKAMRKFIRAMKWPSLSEVDETLRSKDPSVKLLQERSSDAMSYFSGVILPGDTLPFLLMNALVDCDRENNGSGLAELTHMRPHCGFQYGSSTYWSSSCIVGKALAPSCREIAGWVGPAMASRDLERIQIVRVRQRRLRQQITKKEVQSMSIRSDPLGPPPPNMAYPVIEYQPVMPDIEDIVDTIRIEKLMFTAASVSIGKAESGPSLYDSCIQFAIDGKSWPLRLAFDVSYISAWPCAGTPHPLFYDYIYKAVNVDELIKTNGWGAPGTSRSQSTGRDARSEEKPDLKQDDDDIEKVLVVQAFGVPDNEILARAWASHWGLSAVIANVSETCMACAIREAFAACLNVVILTCGHSLFPLT